MLYIYYLIAAVALFMLATALWRGLSVGLSRSAKGQQITRFAVGAVLALLPSAIAGMSSFSINIILMGVVAFCWMLVFPLLDFMSNRHSKAEIDNRMDFAFGLYLFGFLSSSYYALTALCPSWVIDTFYAAFEIPLILMYLFQIGYCAIYRTSVDHDGLKLVLDTNVNEVLEYVKSFPVWAVIVGVVAFVLFVILWFFWNMAGAVEAITMHPLSICAEMLLSVVLCSLMFKGHKSAFRRSGLPGLYYDNRDYARQLAAYSERRILRQEALKVKAPVDCGSDAVAGGKGRTFILVIGESASRDYMEAFSPSDANRGTTPWLSEMARKDGDRAFLFSNAYSCHFQTVPTLERALTAMNQYNSLRFVDAPSVVDLAHALGMKVYWFSNQGHIGQNDTPVTLVAENADYARWTSQRLNHQPYDEELLAMMRGVDADSDKLLVFHLMGSHFTYSNRYPAEHEYFPTRAGADYVAAYRNSLRYTDGLLKSVYSYASENLNLQALVYCSDHADIPDRRRSPSFDGFGQVRIPLAVVLSENYAGRNRQVVSALEANHAKSFSNDLLFDLMGGLWQASSPLLDPGLSLASESYRMKPESTFVHLNSLAVSADPNFNRE